MEDLYYSLMTITYLRDAIDQVYSDSEHLSKFFECNNLVNEIEKDLLNKINELLSKNKMV